jgi:alkylhydroperoxidase family enzyme
MREQELVFLVGLPCYFAVYAVTSTRHLATMAGREPPAWYARLGWPIRTARSPSRALVALLGWTVLTQITPVLVALSPLPAYFRAAHVIELVAVIAWTIYTARRLAA